MFSSLQTTYSLNYQKIQVLEMTKFHSNLKSGNSKIEYELIEMFSTKISKPLIKMTMEGFVDSKIPNDYLYNSI
jgi:hypothetical protein